MAIEIVLSRSERLPVPVLDLSQKDRELLSPKELLSRFCEEMIMREVEERASRVDGIVFPIGSSVSGLFAELDDLAVQNQPLLEISARGETNMGRSRVIVEPFEIMKTLKKMYESSPEGSIEASSTHNLRKLAFGDLRLSLQIPEAIIPEQRISGTKPNLLQRVRGVKSVHESYIPGKIIKEEELVLETGKLGNFERGSLEYHRADGRSVAIFSAYFEKYHQGDKYGRGEFGYSGWVDAGIKYVCALYKPGDSKPGSERNILALIQRNEIAIGG